MLKIRSLPYSGANIILLFDVHTFDTEPQGTSTFLAGLINALPGVAAQQFPGINLEIHCAASSAEKASAYINVPFTFHKIDSAFISRNLWGLPLLSRRIKADFVISQYVRPVWVRRHTATVIHDVLFIDFPKQFGFLYCIYRIFLFGLSAYMSSIVFTVSNYSQERIAEIYGIDPKRIGILANGVASCDTKNLRVSEDVSNCRHVQMLYVSRLEARKRQDWCIRALEDLLREGWDVSLILIGQGSGEYAALVRGLMVECKSLHSSRLLHLEGVSPQELDEAYLKCDIFLFPSLGEGFGIPVIEAAAHGIPCVVSDGSALSELNNYYAGRAFDSDSYADFLASIKHVIEYLEDYKARARKNIKKVVDHFSWNTTAQQFLKSILEYEK